MEQDELRLIDPQLPITLRFGILEDEIEWDEDSWTRMRILVSDGEEDEWFMTPISLDGRPYSLTLLGHTSPRKGRFLSTNGRYVMEVREMMEGDLLRGCYDHNDRCGTLEGIESLEIPVEEMSPMAQLFVQMVEGDGSISGDGGMNISNWVYELVLSHL